MTLTLLRGGRIHTAADPEATALAITGSTVTWIGGEHAVTLAGRPDRVIDLDGAFVAPGFVDAHVHCTDAGLAAEGLDLSGARSLAECLAAIRSYAGRHADPRHHGVIWGHGWDESGWPEGRPPTRGEVDAAVGQRPAYLARVDVHSCLASTALADSVPGLAALDGHSPDGPMTRAANAAVRQAARDRLGPEQRRAAQLAFLLHAASKGVVAVHECGSNDASGREELAALLTGPNPIDVVGYLAAPVTDPEEAAALIAATGAHGLAGDLSVDGALGSRTAALGSPYLDAPQTCGVRYLDDDALTAHLVACALAGVQPGFHAIGDDAVSAVAAALRRAAAELDRRDPTVPGRVRLAGCTPRVEHAEMISPEAIATLAEFGAVASVQPLFDAEWGGTDGMYARRLGGKRAAPMNPFAAMAAAGVGLALGSDAPVTAVGPWRAVQAAVQHRTSGSGLSPRGAFTAHTRGGFRAARTRDHGAGTIAVGAPADIAIYGVGDLVRPPADPSVQRWSTDPRSRVPLLPDLTPGVELPRTVATVVAGRVVFDDGLFGGTES